MSSGPSSPDLSGILRPDLEGIAARAEAATEGPWDLDMNKRWGMWKVVAPASDGDPGFSRKVAESFLTEADAEFVAAARVDLPAVIAYALQLEAKVERLQQADVLLGDAVLLHIAKASDEDWRKFGERYEAYCLSCPSVPDDFEALRKIALGEEVPDVG